MGAVPLCEPARVREVARLSQDPDRRVEVEGGFVGCGGVGRGVGRGSGRGGRGVDEARQGVVVGELGVAVQEERRDVAVGEATRVQLLEVGREVLQALGVEELRKAGRGEVSEPAEDDRPAIGGSAPCGSRSSPGPCRPSSGTPPWRPRSRPCRTGGRRTCLASACQYESRRPPRVREGTRRTGDSSPQSRPRRARGCGRG